MTQGQIGLAGNGGFGADYSDCFLGFAWEPMGEALPQF
jgi:hypothetical protein